MAKFKIQAGAEVDFLTENEAERAFRNALATMHEGGQRFIHRTVAGVSDANGNLTINDPEAGPEPGYVWSVTRVAALLAAQETIALYRNETAPSSFLATVADVPGFIVLPGPALILTPGERLIVAGASLTATTRYTVNLAAIELPIGSAWRLI